MAQARAFAALVWRWFREDRCLTVAESLSYTSLLALVPLTAIGFAALSAFPVFEGVRDRLQAFIFANFLPSAVGVVQQYLNQFAANARGLTALGVLGLALIALLLFWTIEDAINTIFRVSRTRPFVPRLLVFWAILSLGPLLIGASFSLATYFYAYTESLGMEALSAPMRLVSTVLPTLLAIAAFALFYLILPNRPVRLVHALIGASAAGVAFSVLRHGFALYLTYFPVYETLYGALSAIPIFLIWIFLSWLVVLAGAVLTAALPSWGTIEVHTDVRLDPGARLELALALLAVLFAALRNGRGVAERSLVAAVAVGDSAVDAMLAELRAARYVELTAEDRWLPARDPDAVTLYELLQALHLELSLAETRIGIGEESWRARLAAILAANAEQQESLMSITLAELLLGDGASRQGQQASALSLRRTS